MGLQVGYFRVVTTQLLSTPMQNRIWYHKIAEYIASYK